MSSVSKVTPDPNFFQPNPSPHSSDRRRRDDMTRATIMRRLVETGEKDRLKDVLRAKLIECGWRDEMKELCKDTIQSRGVEKVTVDELVADILPRGRAAVPSDIKSDILRDVRNFVKRDSMVR
mmetsp:Transcript_35124/g.51587  ORF Transcript_35124/g.51587 Transcript_35124/m.51587 type:complete len:123 (-) Transcript_35124:363-731(-)|eukprot:CAMPEP_0195520518 /NCGR_PEP_ID=MMETSP0794_2-20130614/17082_1 /TAXON_ID=515487 /ORGANISM="Stephanopyxis turris, Strain CCMP 815" /LENGTH=122 /DNA_ID=CAMNT_0040649895 /DNA_START=175 /DNA_END=543 /DNA_ORIENTATION=+